MREIAFSTAAFEQYNDWGTENRKIQKKIIKLIGECQRTPFEGTGKPEALKHNYRGSWSRRITDGHRLVYEVTDEMIYISSCKFHYDDD
jgi:toxin YoeB